MSAKEPDEFLDTKTIDRLPKGTLGVAVSGGSDSTALLHLLHNWGGRSVMAATVDHQLRPESKDEAVQVATQCARLNIPHEVLLWIDPQTGSNLQERARNARRSLLSNWAAKNNIRSVALGHTFDDQAETVLLRLLRGSGVDGLAAIAPISTALECNWVHPLLASTKADLRAYLQQNHINWCDDPSNENPKFARVRVRKAMDELGLDKAMLVDTAERMRMASQVLNNAAFKLSQECAHAEPLGYIRLDVTALSAAAEDTRLRLLAHALNWVAAATYRPRFRELRGLVDAICKGNLGGGRTLHGCIIRTRGTDVLICRELAQTESQVDAGEIWDQRWLTSGPKESHVGSLGVEGLKQCPNWRDSGHPRDACLASPGFWQGNALISSIFTSNSKEFTLRPVHPLENCFTSLQGC